MIEHIALAIVCSLCATNMFNIDDSQLKLLPIEGDRTVNFHSDKCRAITIAYNNRFPEHFDLNSKLCVFNDEHEPPRAA